MFLNFPFYITHTLLSWSSALDGSRWFHHLFFLHCYYSQRIIAPKIFAVESCYIDLKLKQRYINPNRLNMLQLK